MQNEKLKNVLVKIAEQQQNLDSVELLDFKDAEVIRGGTEIGVPTKCKNGYSVSCTGGYSS